MFHGREPASEDPNAMARNFKLLRSEQFPLRKGWMLSIYLPL